MIFEITASGYLIMDANVASRYFPNDAMTSRVSESMLLLYPLTSALNGGLLLKVRDSQANRSCCLSELLRDIDFAPGLHFGSFDSGAHVVKLNLNVSEVDVSCQ